MESNQQAADFHIGGLARDGISCAVCHHTVEPSLPKGTASIGYFLEHYDNGRFVTGAADKLFGPFQDDTIARDPMKNALGMEPRFASYTTSSKLCGSCHVIDLPVIDAPASQPVRHSVEQATYVEWLNSAYQDEYAPGPRARSCQACHMPSEGTRKIALVQDDTYPKSTGMLPLHLREHPNVARHELVGLNAFLLTMFDQFPQTLGVRRTDYMTGSANGIPDTIDGIVEQARDRTARVRVLQARVRGNVLVLDVEVRNLTGHRFPSGVSFRRAFLDVEVRDASRPAGKDLVFFSGRTDRRGRLIDWKGNLAPSYQPHYDEAHPIVDSAQAEIFEERVKDARGELTSSFLRRDEIVKDNRLLPYGWERHPSLPIPQHFLEATYPEGEAAKDPRYADGLGHAIVRYRIALPAGVRASALRIEATLYYQSLAPYFLAERAAVQGPSSRRLAAIAQNLHLDGTPLQSWKLQIAQASAAAALK